MYSPNNPKIDIYVKGVYVGSTNWSNTCIAAKVAYINKHPNVNPEDVKCKRSK